MPELTPVGRILRPHGVRGECVVEAPAAALAMLERAAAVYLGAPPVAHRLESARRHRGRLLIRLENHYNRDSVEEFRGQVVQIERADLPPGRLGAHSPYQLIGVSVVTDAGERLGQIVEVIETGANDVYVVQGESGEVLLPAIPEVILAVDLGAARLTAHLLDGLR